MILHPVLCRMMHNSKDLTDFQRYLFFAENSSLLLKMAEFRILLHVEIVRRNFSKIPSVRW